MKKTVVFDFDGVIHSYKSGWQDIDIIPDPPVDGIDKVMKKLHELGYYIVIVSTRSVNLKGRTAMREWLANYDIYYDDIQAVKPPAIVYVDDRAICFKGQTDTLVDEIVNFTSWVSN